MINFVNSVADLTSLQDREELELIMARVAGDLLGASTVKLWRFAGRSDALRLHERALLVGRRLTLSDAPSEIDDLPMLDSRPELRACHDGTIPLAVSLDAEGQRRHIFPISNAMGVVGLLDVYVAAPLSDDQQRLVCGLLRIYQNHLKILDYSEQDELTGLLNRKSFDSAFAHLTRIEAPSRPGAIQFERVERRRAADLLKPRWLAVMDVDFFKSINDRFGHSRGDDVLARMARLMRDSFRETDRLFRCGGEEFVVILEPTDARYVRGILERFRTLVEVHEFTQVGAVTISMGYTRVAAGENGAVAFHRADEALYAAKRAGRNRVICYEELASGRIPPAATPVDADASMR